MARGDPVDLSVGAPGEPQVSPSSEPPPELVEPGALPAAPVLAPEITERYMRGLLKGLGGALNRGVADPDVPDQWRFTDQELEDFVPPLTRIVNRRPALRQLVEKGDEFVVATFLAGYAGDNFAAGRAARRARKDAEDASTREAAGPSGMGAAAGGGGVERSTPDGGSGLGVPGAPGR